MGRGEGVQVGRSEGVKVGRGVGVKVGRGVHIYAERGAEVNLLHEEDGTEEGSSTNSDPEISSRLVEPDSRRPSGTSATHTLPQTLKVQLLTLHLTAVYQYTFYGSRYIHVRTKCTMYVLYMRTEPAHVYSLVLSMYYVHRACSLTQS